MSMDLTEDCPHCEAKVGKICTKECAVNGEKIQALEKALFAVGLSLKDIKLPIRKQWFMSEEDLEAYK